MKQLKESIYAPIAEKSFSTHLINMTADRGGPALKNRSIQKVFTTLRTRAAQLKDMRSFAELATAT
jgi:hypothetical protein